jgi:prepilin-type N-terminal cleavage/methylation domain-containing protein
MKRQSGFTLIEIAIVLVIIGLLLGGVLKGQELIQSARVRNLIAMQDGVKAAFFGFQDRFRALPGDYAAATVNINCNPACSNGDGDGQIELVGTGAAVREDIAVWEHLSRAGFINGSFTYDVNPGPGTNAINPYTVPMQVIHDAIYAGVAINKLNVKTGNQIPGDIIAELDRKIDDGNAILGSFRFSAYAIANNPVAGNCHDAAGQWIVIGAVSPNCGGASLF